MNAQQKKQRLVSIAMDLFLQKGFEAVSVEEICRQAGVSKPTFYKYLPAKEEVLASSFLYAREQAIEEAEQLQASRPAAALQKVAGFQTKWAMDIGPELTAALFSYLLKNPECASERSAQKMDILEQAIGAMQDDGSIGTMENPKKLAKVLLDCSDGMCLMWCGLGGTFDVAAAYRSSVVSILDVRRFPEGVSYRHDALLSIQ